MTGIVQQRVAAFEDILRVRVKKPVANEVPAITVSVTNIIAFFDGESNHVQTGHKTRDADNNPVEDGIHFDNLWFETPPTQSEEESKPDKFCDSGLAEIFNRTEEETGLLTPLGIQSPEAFERKSERVGNVSPANSNSFDTASPQIKDESGSDTFCNDDLIENINRIEDHAACHDEIEPNEVIHNKLNVASSELRQLGAPKCKPIRSNPSFVISRYQYLVTSIISTGPKEGRLLATPGNTGA